MTSGSAGAMHVARQLASCALILVSASILLTAQAPKARGSRNAFEAAGALVRGLDKGSRPAPLDLDVTVAIWSDLALRPMPFLRLTHALGSDLTGDLYIWWLPPVAPRPSPRDQICTPPSEGWPVCIARVDVQERVDWASLLVDVVAARVCSMDLTSGVHPFVSDAGDLHVRLSSGGSVDTYSCNAPGGSTRAGAREAVAVMEMLGKLTAAPTGQVPRNLAPRPDLR